MRSLLFSLSMALFAASFPASAAKHLPAQSATNAKTSLVASHGKPKKPGRAPLRPIVRKVDVATRWIFKLSRSLHSIAGRLRATARNLDVD